MDNMIGDSSFPIGSKVRVVNYPRPAMQSAMFDYNGLVGIVKFKQRIGSGLNDQAVYSYQIFFEKVQVPYARKNNATGKIDRGVEVTNAQNFFDESYLERVYSEANPQV